MIVATIHNRIISKIKAATDLQIITTIMIIIISHNGNDNIISHNGSPIISNV